MSVDRKFVVSQINFARVKELKRAEPLIPWIAVPTSILVHTTIAWPKVSDAVVAFKCNIFGAFIVAACIAILTANCDGMFTAS